MRGPRRKVNGHQSCREGEKKNTLSGGKKNLRNPKPKRDPEKRKVERTDLETSLPRENVWGFVFLLLYTAAKKRGKETHLSKGRLQKQ